MMFALWGVCMLERQYGEVLIIMWSVVIVSVGMLWVGMVGC